VTVVSKLVASDHPQNRDLLDYLREQAVPRESATYRWAHLDGWELHTHPDLMERLRLVAPADSGPLIPVFGVPVLAVHGIVAVAALGTAWLMVKIPELRRSLLNRIGTSSGWLTPTRRSRTTARR
jgi:hypothetical protein